MSVQNWEGIESWSFDYCKRKTLNKNPLDALPIVVPFLYPFLSCFRIGKVKCGAKSEMETRHTSMFTFFLFLGREGRCCIDFYYYRNLHMYVYSSTPHPQLCVFSDKNICNQSEHVLYVGYFIIFFRRVEHHVTVHRELPQANSQHNQLNMNMNVNMRMETVSVRKQSRAYALQFTAFCCCMVSGLWIKLPCIGCLLSPPR